MTSLISIGLVALVVILVTPLITIWSLNTLFALGIPYTILTWAATLWLTSFVAVTAVRGK